jgi:hypothetical protein
MTHRRPPLWRLATLALMTVAVSSCDVLGVTIGGDGHRRRLELQEARWASQNISAYRLMYQRDCFCGSLFTAPVVVEVRGGNIATAQYAESDEPIPLDMQQHLPTVESLFAIIRDAIDRDSDMIDVTYDPVRGYPRKIAIDYRFNTADDEVTHRVSSLEIFLPPIVP